MASNINNLYTKPAKKGTTFLADQRLTVDATAGGVAFTDYTEDYVDTVELDVQDAAVFCTFDDSAPTTTNGHKLSAGEKFTWSKDRFNAAKFIRATAVSAVIHASPSSI